MSLSRRTPLAQGGKPLARTPLTRGSGLNRSSSTRRTAMAQAAPRPTWDAEVRALVVHRDGGRCWVCAAQGGSVHHRKPRGMGGTHRDVTAAWGVVLCGSGTTGCHGWVETHRTEAVRLGLLVQGDQEPPELVPLWRPAMGEWVLLDAQGRMTVPALQPADPDV